jgi:hypothetical protein
VDGMVGYLVSDAVGSVAAQAINVCDGLGNSIPAIAYSKLPTA